MNQAGVGRYGRYRIIPEAGVEHLADATAKGKDVNFLFDDLTRRLSAGPISFRIVVQVANENDIVDNATINWPEDRPLINFGKLTLTGTVPHDAREQKQIVFYPIPRRDGIEPPDYHSLALRSPIYRLSERRRPHAPE